MLSLDVCKIWNQKQNQLRTTLVEKMTIILDLFINFLMRHILCIYDCDLIEHLMSQSSLLFASVTALI